MNVNIAQTKGVITVYCSDQRGDNGILLRPNGAIVNIAQTKHMQILQIGHRKERYFLFDFFVEDKNLFFS